MEDRRYEEEYSLLEIAKYNLKHWPVLLLCALVCGLLAGAYGYKHTEPSVVYYEQLQQINGAYLVTEYNDTSITERMYDVQQIALSKGAYDRFIQNTQYDMTYEDYTKVFSYSNYMVTSVLNMVVAYPETYGEVILEDEADAIAFMQNLMDAQIATYDEYLGNGAVSILSTPYSSSYTQASADAATTTKDLVIATTKGGIAGIFLGLLMSIVVVSIIYLIGTVAKQAKEIEEKLNAPVVAFVHKDDRTEEFKKVTMFIEQEMQANELLCYIPYNEKNADGAYDIAKAFSKMQKKTLLVNLSCSAKADGIGISEFLFGKCSAEDISVHVTEDGVDVVTRNVDVEDGQELLASRVLAGWMKECKEKYERVVINAPDILKSSDAYGISAYCDKVLIGCKRREVTGTDLYEIHNTMKNNRITLNGVVVYGN